ncbi:MAG: hypothetical protein A2922_01035 [Candidatus Nealsonbacteria bacterium RIFCSPLOWO2_01_FULL_43_36]|uniref:Phosphomannomutase/phosphoglucomutase n=1 Tax=Candidatus Nealsonbacteria bacterium RIFCSPHIGHO2_02_FULL_43_13 TaxID=1801668 RepID=A0A1G2E5U4_9BACT|nr:MAG: hypothetical protein A3D46_00205 [Candidatus Nealsonbacteria bacterium RIFCSPHIGHO2_02_FULL_43_13]OGZ25375.1 MAG: hypothetical protein A2922_01035 [Candidatus Nealsonbacteria bacterium RIFCSPLOWO2_01_FULL_43_36]
MKVNPEIFRAYDIRGIYPEMLNEEAAYLIGRAFVKFLKKQRPTVVVGKDARLSTPKISSHLIKGITDQGGNVVDIGLSITPMLYFAAAHFKYDGGINVTASHNPPQYNGLKLVREKAIPISGDSGMEEIKEMVLRGRFKDAEKGRAIKKNVSEEYIKFNLKDHNLKMIKPLKVVVDTANAVPGLVVKEFFKKTNCKIDHLFADLDGNFPNHLPSPHEEKNLGAIKREVLKKKADLGIAFDGDGDRIIFVDEKGEIIPGDFITALMAELILKENPGEKVLCDVRSSNIIREAVKMAGGRVVIGRIGHSFIKERMRKENIIFQGELNGHYYLRSHYFSEAPFFVILKIIEEVSKTGKKISELVKDFAVYYHSGEINFKINDKKGALKALEDKFKDGKILKIDGLRIDFEDWWFNVRPSNTEPLLRLVLEAKTKKLLAEKKEELLALLNPGQ